MSADKGVVDNLTAIQKLSFQIDSDFPFTQAVFVFLSSLHNGKTFLYDFRRASPVSHSFGCVS